MRVIEAHEPAAKGIRQQTLVSEVAQYLHLGCPIGAERRGRNKTAFVRQIGVGFDLAWVRRWASADSALSRAAPIAMLLGDTSALSLRFWVLSTAAMATWYTA